MLCSFFRSSLPSHIFAHPTFFFFFFFNDTATTEIYTLSLHDALPIYRGARGDPVADGARAAACRPRGAPRRRRSEEHTSELQSRLHLVCRLLLEKKKKTKNYRDNGQHHTPRNWHDTST